MNDVILAIRLITVDKMYKIIDRAPVDSAKFLNVSKIDILFACFYFGQPYLATAKVLYSFFEC